MSDRRHFSGRSVTALAVALIAALSAAPARAAAVAYDGFGYTPGQSLSGQNGGVGWTGAWTRDPALPGDPTITAAGLSTTFLPATPGAVTNPTSPAYLSRDSSLFLPLETGTFWLSFLFRSDSLLAGTAGLVVGSSSTTAPGTNGLFIGDIAGIFGLQGAGLSDAVLSPVTVNASTTYQVVMRLDFNIPGSSTKLFINPTTATDAPVATYTSPNIFQPSRVAISSALASTIDEIRIGGNFADVVPEPASIALLALGVTTLARRRRNPLPRYS